jgi:hypothetical protein
MKQSLVNLLRAHSSKLRATGRIGLITAGMSCLVFTASPLLADISVNLMVVGPPAPRPEVVIEANRPGPDYVWVGGYWGGSPGNYVWASGHWDRPPHDHAHAHWVAPQWQKDHDGHYQQTKGEWRD